MTTTQTIAIPAPLQYAKIKADEPLGKWFGIVQSLNPLRLGDTTAGPYSEALPPAGLDPSTGASNQNAEITYKKMSADANNWTITGATEGAQVLSAQYAKVRFKSDGAQWVIVG